MRRAAPAPQSTASVPVAPPETESTRTSVSSPQPVGLLARSPKAARTASPFSRADGARASTRSPRLAHMIRKRRPTASPNRASSAGRTARVIREQPGTVDAPVPVLLPADCAPSWARARPSRQPQPRRLTPGFSSRRWPSPGWLSRWRIRSLLSMQRRRQLLAVVERVTVKAWRHDANHRLSFARPARRSSTEICVVAKNAATIHTPARPLHPPFRLWPEAAAKQRRNAKRRKQVRGNDNPRTWRDSPPSASQKSPQVYRPMLAKLAGCWPANRGSSAPRSNLGPAGTLRFTSSTRPIGRSPVRQWAQKGPRSQG